MDFKKFLVAAGVDPQYHEQMVADLAAVKAVGGVFLPNGNREINDAFKALWHESGLVYKVLPGVGMVIGTAKRNAKPESKTEADLLKAKMEEQAKKIALLEAALASLPAGKKLEEVLVGNGEKITAPDVKAPVTTQRRSGGRPTAPPPTDI